MSEIADFDQLLVDIEASLRRDRRLAYRILKRRYSLDDDDIEDIKADLIDAKQIAADEGGKVLVLQDAGLSTTRAERRQLTVMFCDIVGSTRLSEALDPEDFRELVRLYQQLCGGAIDDAGGHVAQYLGDGILVYFGYPIAYEDAAERAVSCGLDIIQRVSKELVHEGEAVQVRVGIHTGTVVVGDIGGGAHLEQLALGDTPNVAARIEASAAPNELLISEVTLRLLHDAFDFEVSGEHALRGVAAPITLYRVLRARDLRTRFRAVRQANAAPHSGRERELKRLKDAWSVTKQGIHSKYFIHADAGIGKSRLVQEIREIARADGGTPMTVMCSQLNIDTALYPFIDLIHRALRTRQDDPPALKLERLRAVLAELNLPNEDSEDVLAALLSAKHEFGEAFNQLSPEQRQQRTFETILDWMCKVAKRTPVLLAIEDLQYADPSTLDLIELGLDRFEDTSTLMLMVAREEFNPPWGRRGDIVDMRLRRLEPDAVKKIISAVCQGRTLPPILVDQILEKSDGVPLYAEEFTKMVLESDLLDKRDNTYVLKRELKSLSIPSSLQDSLMARLDRLRDGKNVAQWGACIGREFSYQIIKALLPDEILDNGLKELVDLGIIYKRKRTLQTIFIFKHALIQDAAYASLLKSERREYHARIARVLIEEFPTQTEENPELVARHLASADRYEDAVSYWLKAGKNAGTRAAHKVGLAHFAKGLELIERTPAGKTRDAQELQLLIGRGPLLIPLRGNGSQIVFDNYSRALELSRKLNNTDARFPILFGLRSFYLASGELAKAHELSRELIHIAQASGDAGQRLEAHTALANTYFFRGDFIEVENEAKMAMSIYDRRRFRHHAHIYGTDPGVLCLSRLSNASWQRARPDRGRIHLEEMLELARYLEHQYTLSSALNLAALTRMFRREPELALACAEEAFALSETHDFKFVYAWSRMLRGQAWFDMGQVDVGMRELEAGFEATRDLNANLMEPWFSALLADAKTKVKEHLAADRLLDTAFASVAATGTNYALPMLYCLRGESLHTQNASPNDAYEAFITAASLARSQDSKALEIRASAGILRTRLDHPDEAEALALVKKLLSNFITGPDSKDIVDIAKLVDDISAS